MVVHLRDDVVDFLITDINTSLQKNLFELACFNDTIAIYINFLEGFTHLLHLLFARSLYEQVHSSFLESRNAFEASKSLQDIIADFTILRTTTSCRCLCSLSCHISEPWVIQSVLTTDAIALIDNEKLFDQVLAFIAHIVELWVIEVILSDSNLAEDLCCVFALERKVTTDKDVQDDTKLPKIGLNCVSAFEHVWGHVVGCTSNSIHPLKSFMSLGKTEIDEAN